MANNLSFGTFVWPNDPEKYEEKCVRELVYTKDEEGNTVFSGMSAVKRTITGSGVFFGSGAYTNFKALLTLLNQAEAATLTHPVWGERRAFLTELASAMEPRADYVAYSFVFREAGEDGSIPK